jgi:hypothetical protein
VEDVKAATEKKRPVVSLFQNSANKKQLWSPALFHLSRSETRRVNSMSMFEWLTSTTFQACVTDAKNSHLAVDKAYTPVDETPTETVSQSTTNSADPWCCDFVPEDLLAVGLCQNTTSYSTYSNGGLTERFRYVYRTHCQFICIV